MPFFANSARGRQGRFLLLFLRSICVKLTSRKVVACIVVVLTILGAGLAIPRQRRTADEPKVVVRRKRLRELAGAPIESFTNATVPEPAASGSCNEGRMTFLPPQGTFTYPRQIQLHAAPRLEDETEAAAALRRCTAILQIVFIQERDDRTELEWFLQYQFGMLRRLGLAQQTLSFVAEDALESFCAANQANCVIPRSSHFCASGKPCVTRRLGQWEKLWGLKAVLQQGFNALLLESDVVPLKNPFPHFHPDVLVQAVLDGYKRYSWKFHYYNNGLAFWRPSEMTINVLDATIFNGAVSMDESMAQTEQGLLNQQLVATEDWLPEATAVNFTRALDPTMFAQLLWTPPTSYSRGPEHPQHDFVHILDYLLSPPQHCEFKLARMVTLHFNGNKRHLKKELSESGLEKLCTVALKNRDKWLKHFYCADIALHPPTTQKQCLATWPKPPSGKNHDTEYWLWSGSHGAMWNPNLALRNGRFVAEVSEPSASWMEFSRPCWKLCPQGDDEMCEDKFCKSTEFKVQGGMMKY